MKTILLSAAAMLIAGIALAAVYTYKCPKCGNIQQYTQPGFYKCGSDGWTLIPVQ